MKLGEDCIHSCALPLWLTVGRVRFVGWCTTVIWRTQQNWYISWFRNKSMKSTANSWTWLGLALNERVLLPETPEAWNTWSWKATDYLEDFAYLLVHYPVRGPVGHVFSPATQQFFQKLQFYNNLVQEPHFSYKGKTKKIFFFVMQIVIYSNFRPYWALFLGQGELCTSW